jgi:hypothetical protein
VAEAPARLPPPCSKPLPLQRGNQGNMQFKLASRLHTPAAPVPHWRSQAAKRKVTQTQGQPSPCGL